jgi:hypothetical protein
VVNLGRLGCKSDASRSQSGILEVLDEELLIGIERQVPDEEPEREVAPVPELAAA